MHKHIWVDKSLLANLMGYVIDDYGHPDMSIHVVIENDRVSISGKSDVYGDFLSWPKHLFEFINNKIVNGACKVMRAANVRDLTFLFSGVMLVDAFDVNRKWLSPGMLSDLFSSIFDIQKTSKLTHLTEDVIKASSGKILKPGTFRTTIVGNELVPLYAKVEEDA